MSVHQFRDAGAPEPPVIESGSELFALLVDAAGGISNVDSHESDLYVPSTEATRAIIRRWRYRCNVQYFKSNIDGKIWIDLPFCFMPWWEQRYNSAQRAERLAARERLEGSNHAARD